ncbi:MAG: efflux RND transporter periplasmic adaptor subunit [Pseudomonadota bacterium]
MSATNRAVVVVLALGVGLGSGYGLSRLSHRDGDAVRPPADGQQPLYWYDPMVPNQHFEKPGKSPYMDMQLVPRYPGAGAEPAETPVRIAPGIVQNLGMRLARVKRGAVAPGFEAPAVIQYDQRQTAVVQARIRGFVQGIRTRAAGDVVESGAALADVLVPDWASAQAEFLSLIRSKDSGLIDAARQRLALLGMPSDLIARIERTGRAESVFVIRAPSAGVIESIDVRPGMTLEIGATVARISGLTSVWLEASVPVGLTAMTTVAQSVEVRVAGSNDRIRTGKVLAVLPEASSETRTLKVRVSLDNSDGTLRPGMFAQIRLRRSEGDDALLVPAEAVIRTGTRSLVIVFEDGRFTPVPVEIGAEAGGQAQILKGLEEGQQVVASGQFLIDSEANLQGVLARMGTPGPDGKADAMDKRYQATGKIESISSEQILISHGPVADLQWPAMTMGFELRDAKLTSGMKAGDAVSFEFRKDGEHYVVDKVHKAGTPP